jgi:hypothetical protein
MPAGTNITSLSPAIQFIGQSISPAPNVAQDFTNPVTYTVTAVDNTTRAYTVTVSLASGINDIKNNTISVYPNPCGEKLLVAGYSLLVNTIQVTDVFGRVVLQQINIPQQIGISTQQIQIEVSGLSSGIYFIKAIDINGNAINTKLKKVFTIPPQKASSMWMRLF